MIFDEARLPPIDLLAATFRLHLFKALPLSSYCQGLSQKDLICVNLSSQRSCTSSLPCQEWAGFLKGYFLVGYCWMSNWNRIKTGWKIYFFFQLEKNFWDVNQNTIKVLSSFQFRLRIWPILLMLLYFHWPPSGMRHWLIKPIYVSIFIFFGHAHSALCRNKIATGPFYNGY